MKHNVCLSMVISLFFITDSVASESLENIISQGTATGQVKSLFFAQDFSDSSGIKAASVWTNGGEFNLTSGSFYNFKLGSSLQFVDVTSINDDDGAYKTSMDADGAVLSEAFIDYSFAKTQLRLGRQYLAMPLIGGSAAQGITESYTAYLVTDKSIDNTVIIAGKVTEYQARTDSTSATPFTKVTKPGEGKPGEFLDIGEHGMYSVYVSNESITNTKIQFHAVETQDIAFIGYADIMHKLDTKFTPFVGLQYYKTIYHDNELGDDSDMLGVKAGLHLNDNLSLFSGYNSTSDSGKVLHGLGNNAYANYTTTTKTSGDLGFEAGSKSVQLGIAYKTQLLDMKYRLTQFDMMNSEDDMLEHTFNVSYQFESVKGLYAMVDFSIMDFENKAKSMTDLRTKIIYKF